MRIQKQPPPDRGRRPSLLPAGSTTDSARSVPHAGSHANYPRYLPQGTHGDWPVVYDIVTGAYFKQTGPGVLLPMRSDELMAYLEERDPDAADAYYAEICEREEAQLVEQANPSLVGAELW